jgi:putative transposase
MCEPKPGARPLVARPEDRKWSSVRAHLAGVDDALVTVQPVLDRVPHLKPLLLQGNAEEDFSDLRRAESTGRPLGAPEFLIASKACSDARLLAAPQAANRKCNPPMPNS